MPSSFRLQLLIFQTKVFGIQISVFSFKSLALLVGHQSFQDQLPLQSPLIFSWLLRGWGSGVPRESRSCCVHGGGEGTSERNSKRKEIAITLGQNYGHPK